MTAELFMLDAAAIIEKVFPNQAVHLFGWSLGGFIGYQLAIYKPHLVKSLFVYGSTSCFAPIPEGQTECVDRRSSAKVLFSRGPIMRLLGLEAEANLGAMVAKFKTPFSYQTQQYFYSLRMDQKVKTPRVWLQVQGAKTFSQISQIVCPFQQLAGEHEGLVTGATQYSMELEASLIPQAEPPVMLNDPAGEGYSHFAIFEEGGMDFIVGHLKAFYDRHA
jgi:pimeloyl-ACP methyl ester carboxylesterase